MIAPDEWVSDARSDDPNIGPLDSARGWSLRSLRNGHSADTPDKAGPLGCRGKQIAAGAKKAIAFTKHTRRTRPLASALPRPAAERSGFVRCVRAVSVSQ